MANTMAKRDRRNFLLQIGGLADSRKPERRGNPRSEHALLMRQIAAVMQRQRAPESTITNGDEQLYPNFIASATKGLLHSQLGIVDPVAYQSVSNT